MRISKTISVFIFANIKILPFLVLMIFMFHSQKIIANPIILSPKTIKKQNISLIGKSIKFINIEKYKFDTLQMIGCQVISDANFSYSVFANSSSFFSTKFIKNVNFTKCKFFVEPQFESTKFKNNVSFNNAIFYRQSNFTNVEFMNVEFLNTVFNGTAYFNETRFLEKVDFEKVKFDGIANFYKVSFYKELLLIDTEFSKKTLFSYSKFYLPPSLKGCLLPDTLYFDKVDLSGIKEDIDFTNCQLKNKTKKCIIILSQTDVSKILLPSSLFELGFVNNEASESSKTLYDNIIKKCVLSGMVDSAEGWQISYNKYKVNQRFGKYGHYLNLISSLWWNFGYDKWKILWIWLPLFYFIFLLINTIKIDYLFNNVYKDLDLGKSYNIYPNFKNIKERISYSIFFTAVLYFGVKLEHEAINYKNFIGVLYLYLMYIIGSIHLAFGIGYILQA